MGRRLYVGNLPYSATEEQLTELFTRAGKVDNVRVMRDMATGRARGFAFVEMASDEDAQKAISEFHEQQMEGRALVVNEARPKPEGGFGGGGGGGAAAVAAAGAASTTEISPAVVARNRAGRVRKKGRASRDDRPFLLSGLPPVGGSHAPQFELLLQSSAFRLSHFSLPTSDFRLSAATHPLPTHPEAG